jgi:2,5-diketo-D-gluconate reductase B
MAVDTIGAGMGLSLPPIGLGTANNDDPEECAATVADALEMGYRHVDTAQMYGNEAAVGDGIERADVPREECIVATKVAPERLDGTDVYESARQSRDRLGGQIDLLYVHWPTKSYSPTDTLSAFDQLRKGDVTRNVGVSNFTPELLEEARAALESPIAAHQVECHPLLQQRELREDAREYDYTLVAYCPVMRGEVADVPELREIAEERDVTPAQVSLAWLAGLENVVAIPKASGERHLRENLAAADVALDEDERERIEGIDRERRLVDPEDAPW